MVGVAFRDARAEGVLLLQERRGRTPARRWENPRESPRATFRKGDALTEAKERPTLKKPRVRDPKSSSRVACGVRTMHRLKVCATEELCGAPGNLMFRKGDAPTQAKERPTLKKPRVRDPKSPSRVACGVRTMHRLKVCATEEL
jgi:hypothetical protein